MVGGFTEPRGSRDGVRRAPARLLRLDGALQYAGKVGTGFDHIVLTDLGARLRELDRGQSPFADPASIRERGVHLGQARAWSARSASPSGLPPAGCVTHGFQGLRDDKPAVEVVRER